MIYLKYSCCTTLRVYQSLPRTSTSLKKSPPHPRNSEPAGIATTLLLITSPTYGYDPYHKMLDIIRDAPAGQFLRWLTSNRILLYPDEREGFVLPKLARVLSIHC